MSRENHDCRCQGWTQTEPTKPSPLKIQAANTLEMGKEERMNTQNLPI